MASEDRSASLPGRRAVIAAGLAAAGAALVLARPRRRTLPHRSGGADGSRPVTSASIGVPPSGSR